MAVPIYTPNGWVDDDGSGTVGTLVSAGRMNGLEAAARDASLRTRVVRVATKANQPVGGASNVPTVDGVALVDGDRVLLYGQANPVENGVYQSQAVAGLRTLTRAADFAIGADVQSGQVIFVTEGATHVGRSFIVGVSNPNVGVTPITFVPPAAAVEGFSGRAANNTNPVAAEYDWTAISLAVERLDTGGTHDLVNAAYAWTAHRTGWFMAHVHGSWDQRANGVRGVRIRLWQTDASIIDVEGPPNPLGYTTQHGSTPVFLQAGQTLIFEAKQQGSGAIVGHKLDQYTDGSGMDLIYLGSE